jgi:hypothetical protein
MELDPISIKPFFNGYELKCKEQFSMMNIDAWYHGLYVKDAILSSFCDTFTYPDKPLDLTTKDDVPEEPHDKSVNTDALRFSAFTKSFNQNFIKQHPEGQ